jgi:hypothetical protein
VAAAVPFIEVSDYADTFGIRRPNREQNTRDTIDLVVMSAEKSIGMTMATFTEDMKIKVREVYPEVIGIVADMFPVGTVAPYQAVVLRYRSRVAMPFEKITPGYALQYCTAVSQTDFIRLGVEYANDSFCAIRMEAEHVERIVVSGFMDTEQITAERWQNTRVTINVLHMVRSHSVTEFPVLIVTIV